MITGAVALWLVLKVFLLGKITSTTWFTLSWLQVSQEKQGWSQLLMSAKMTPQGQRVFLFPS
jgi:cobalamin synthase